MYIKHGIVHFGYTSTASKTRNVARNGYHSMPHSSQAASGQGPARATKQALDLATPPLVAGEVHEAGKEPAVVMAVSIVQQSTSSAPDGVK